eukprot:1980699-Pyramimonas_sp.AAC.2
MGMRMMMWRGGDEEKEEEEEDEGRRVRRGEEGMSDGSPGGGDALVVAVGRAAPGDDRFDEEHGGLAHASRAAQAINDRSNPRSEGVGLDGGRDDRCVIDPPSPRPEPTH